MNAESRGQWTSASQAAYDALCPGRHLAQRDIPEAPQTEDAASGSRIHAALAGEAVDLTADEQETRDACFKLYERLVKTWSTPWRIAASSTIAEKRLWIDLGNGLLHSGKPDLVLIDRQNHRALIIDWKTGRGEIADNPRNLQLRDLAVLVASNHSLTEVTVAIIQPWAAAQPPCVYGLKDLVQALEELEARVKASNDPKSPRIAGPEQCHFCRAKKECTAFAASALPVPLDGQPAPTADDIAKAICSMNGERLGLFLGLVRLADEVATDQVRQRLAAGEKVDGWKISPGRMREMITHPQLLFDRFVLAGGKTEQFLKAITVQKGKLKDQIREVCNVKGRALEARMAEMLQGLTESKQGAEVLERE